MRSVAAIGLALALSGCAVVEVVLEGFAAIAAQNEDQPRFAYTLDRLGATDVFIAVLTVEDQAYQEARWPVPITAGEVYPGEWSPDNRFLEVGFVEFIAGGDIDVGAVIFDLATGDLESFITDNTVAGALEAACDLAPIGQAVFEDFLSDAVPDNERLTYTFRVIAFDDSSNALTGGGWIDAERMLVGYSGLFMVEFLNADGAVVGSMPLEGGGRLCLSGRGMPFGIWSPSVRGRVLPFCRGLCRCGI